MNAPKTSGGSHRARGRILARTLLIAVIVVSQVLIWWTRDGIQTSSSDRSNPGLLVSLLKGEQYGLAYVLFNDETPISVEEAAERLARGGLPRVIEIRVAGGVVQRDVARLRRAILDGSEHQAVTVRIVVIDDFSVGDVGVAEKESSRDELSEVSL